MSLWENFEHDNGKYGRQSGDVLAGGGWRWLAGGGWLWLAVCVCTGNRIIIVGHDLNERKYGKYGVRMGGDEKSE